LAGFLDFCPLGPSIKRAFFCAASERKDVAIVLSGAFAIVFALAGVTCWIWPGAIGGARVIGSLFFVVAAALFMIRKPDDNAP